MSSEYGVAETRPQYGRPLSIASSTGQSHAWRGRRRGQASLHRAAVCPGRESAPCELESAVLHGHGGGGGLQGSSLALAVMACWASAPGGGKPVLPGTKMSEVGGIFPELPEDLGVEISPGLSALSFLGSRCRQGLVWPSGHGADGRALCWTAVFVMSFTMQSTPLSPSWGRPLTSWTHVPGVLERTKACDHPEDAGCMELVLRSEVSSLGTPFSSSGAPSWEPSPCALPVRKPQGLW